LVAIGFIIKYIQTHQLGEVDYGEYAFFTGLTTFLVLFFKFGFFSSIQVLLTHNYNPQRERKLLGAGYLIALLNGIGMALIMWLASYFVNDLFNTHIGVHLQMLAPLTFILPFDFLIGSYTTGTNRIKVLSYFKVLPKLVYLTALIVVYLLSDITLQNTILLNLISTIFYGFFLLFYLNPDFRNLGPTLRLIWNKNGKYGIHEYTGSVLGQATYNLDQLFISFYINTTQLGFYSLALLLCTPMIMMSQSVSRSIFRSYSSRHDIPKKLIHYNILWLSLCVLFLALFSKIIVTYLFGVEFLTTVDYILPLTVVFFIHGLYIPYSFLEAKSKGKELRNAKLLEAAINIVGNIILIPIYHVYGAIITSAIAKLVYYFLIRRYYLIYQRERGLKSV
jgi:O-antigen/teichoic acid export membrane protein